MYEFEAALNQMEKEEKQRLNRKMNSELLRNITAQANRDLKKEYWEANKKLPGISNDGSRRHVARIPLEVYNFCNKMYGDDFWDKPENLMKFKDYLLVDHL